MIQDPSPLPPLPVLHTYIGSCVWGGGRFSFGALGLLLFLFWQGGDLLLLLSAVCGDVTEVSALRVLFLSILSGLTGTSVPVCVTASEFQWGTHHWDAFSRWHHEQLSHKLGACHAASRCLRSSAGLLNGWKCEVFLIRSTCSHQTALVMPSECCVWHRHDTVTDTQPHDAFNTQCKLCVHIPSILVSKFLSANKVKTSAAKNSRF